MNCTYILRCADGSFYTGWTNDLEGRIRQHNDGAGAKYTRARRPVELVYYEIHASKSEAMKRECAIKRLSRKQKESLVAEFEAGRLQSSLSDQLTVGRPSPV